MKLTYLYPVMFLLLMAATAGSQTTIQFAATSYSAAESAGSVTLTVQRVGDTNPVVGVDFATVDGTATNGLKYVGTSGPLTFAAGITNQTITVPILDEGLVEGTRTFRVVLSNPTGGAVLGSDARTNVTVSITDNDVGVQFQFATYSVVEDAGTVIVSVVRGDDGTNAAAVDLATSNLTGVSGVDYTGVTSNLVFAPQERLKFVPISILNNSLKQGNRTFRVTLSNPVGLTLGSQKTTTVTIVDNDQGFRFDAINYTVTEDAGVVRVAVLRGTDDTNSPVTVDFATSDVISTSGVDYIGVTNTVAFAPGEEAQFIAIQLLNNGLKKGTRYFHAILSNPTGGAVLGSPTTATVSIININPGIGFETNSYSVWENAGSLTMVVVRGNTAFLGPITVDYATSDGTAAAGVDYQATNGTLAFQQNETVKTITVPILPDGLATNNTYFRVTLGNPTGGAMLGTAITTVNIQDATGLAGTFRRVAPGFDTALTIHQDAGYNVLSWSGGGHLQRADCPTGPWQTLTTATNPYAFQSALPTTFYRVTRPRPVNVYIPSNYNGQTDVPLVILLHHFSGNGAEQEKYMRFRPWAEARGFLYCYPDALPDPWGNHPWNGTDACCDFANAGVNDVGYLRSLIQETRQQFAVDQKRIYLIGGSSGGFMAYRMACESADLIAGIASLAGSTFLDSGRCQPSEPVNILHIQGSSDATVLYWGGSLTAPNYPSNMPPFPAGPHAVQLWAGYNGASDPVTDLGPSMDLDLDLPGLDTVVARYTNAPTGGAVELWTIVGGGHVPTLYSDTGASEFAPRVVDWLLAHPKP